MTHEVNRLAAFFYAVLDELRKKLSPDAFSGLFEEYAAKQREDVGDSTPTPSNHP